MLALLYKLLRPILFQLDAERSHHFTLRLLSYLPDAYLQKKTKKNSRNFSLPLKLMGIDFLNPIGLAAGFDKNAQCLQALAALGFGFVEIGTVVPQPQQGNPKPRVFRLKKDQAIINRLGFNSKGLDYVAKQLERRPKDLIIGVNIGKNFATDIANAASDYITCMKRLYQYADYFTLNISSPNTPQLRELGSNKIYLEKLLSEVKQQHDKLRQQHGNYVPIVVKLSPDETESRLIEIAQSLLEYNIDGVIISNTTSTRPKLVDPQAKQSGGLSGRPVAALSNNAIEIVKQATAGKLPIIGVGGILSASDASDKIKAGADLLQLYTGLVYKGPGLIKDIYNMLKQERT